MAKGNLAACLAITLPHEGGYTNDKRDPGNWTGGKVGVGILKGTKYGIAANTFPALDIKNLTPADVEPVYRVNYWNKIKGDQLPAGPDASIFDYGVNSGPSRSIKDLQRVLGVQVDGDLGPATLNKLRAADGKRVIQGHCARRLSFMQSLKIWNTFKRGWSRRVADVEARAVAMWLTAGRAMSADQAAPILDAEAAKADATARAHNKQAATTTGGGVTAGGADAYVGGDINWLLIGGLAVVVLVVVAILIVHSKKNRERASAYREVALNV